MPTSTPRQGLPVPVGSDDPDIPDDLMKLAVAIEKRLFGVYNSIADRDAKNAAPEEGQIAFTKDTDRVYYYDGTEWKQLWPVSGLPSITSGTTAPSNATGANGDVYIQV